MQEIENRIVHYWSQRSHDFGTVRRNELNNEMGQKWLNELVHFLPENRDARILDIGTGTGFFPVLLAQAGYRAEGIDLTGSMLTEAQALAAAQNLNLKFHEMDAQELLFPSDTFDAVISRNLTWTLPDPKKAYSEWFRVLKPGGILLNYDADYAGNVRSASTQNCKVSADSPYGHVGMTDELQKESDAITLALDIGQPRPVWDLGILKEIGFTECCADQSAGKQLLGEHDLVNAPMFRIYARKPQMSIAI